MYKNKSDVIGKIISFFFFFIVIIGMVESFFENKSENITVSDPGFTIENYNLSLLVSERGKIDVVEDITVDWQEDNHHGIVRFIPEWYEYTSKDDKTIKRKAKLSNLRTDKEPFEVDTVKKKKRIKIGNPNEYVDYGLHTYQIKYTYDMGSDPYKGFDEFIFHSIGDYWGTDVKNATIAITLPKAIDKDSVHFYKDKYRLESLDSVLSYTVVKNKIYATFTGGENMEKLDRALTIDVELPDGYFKKGSYTYGYLSIFISVFILILTILVIYWFIRYGKNHKKGVQTLEFYPPDDLDPAEIGYIYTRSINRKQMIALFVSLAKKKYIKIDQEKKDILVTRLNCPPKKKDHEIKQEIVIQKLKESDESLEKAQQALLNSLFKNGEKVTLSSKSKTLKKYQDFLVNSGYIKITRDNSEEYDKETKLLEQEYNEEMEKFKKTVGEKNVLSVNEKYIFDELFKNEETVHIKEHKTLYRAFNKVASHLEQKLKDKVIDKTAKKYKIFTFLIATIIFILSLMSYFVVEDLPPKLNFLYILPSLCILICIFFGLFMGRKTEYGEKILGRVLGFRHFLLTAEKEQLEAMVEKNPSYFYDILPYTYVLNVSKKWISKFEKMEIYHPDFEGMGNMDYTSMSSLSDLSSSVYVPSSSTSGSSSSCGGGCSSCGGGCSSCGGGGSW